MNIHRHKTLFNINIAQIFVLYVQQTIHLEVNISYQLKIFLWNQ